MESLYLMNDTLVRHKRFAITAAEELCYPSHVVRKIEKATTIYEIDRIMKKAREEFWHDKD